MNGVVTLTTGTYGNVFRFLPPLTMPVHLLEEALTILEQAFEDVDGGVERRPDRTVDRLAIPASVFEPLTKKAVDDLEDVDEADAGGRGHARNVPRARAARSSASSSRMRSR